MWPLCRFLTLILEDPHLLIGSSPGSLPHHEAFGWATLFVGGSSATARRPHISHLCLIFHNICHLTQNKLCKYQLTHTKHFLFWTLSGEGSLRIPLPGWGDGRWLHPQAQGDRWLSRGLGLQLHSGETWDQPEEFKREVKVCKNTESAVFGMTYSTNYNIIHFCMCAQLWLYCLAGLTFSLLIVFFVWGGERIFPPHLFVSVIIHRFVEQLPTPSRFTILTLNSSMILRMPLPRAPMMRAWTLLSRVMSSEIISSSSSTMAWMASRAAMALCSYPVIVIWSYGDTAELI